MFDVAQITEWTVGALAWHLQALHMRLLWTSVPEGEPDYQMQIHQARESSPLREEIALLCRVANGEVAREDASDVLVSEVADTVQGIVEVTAGPAVLNSYTIDDGYWSTPIGELVAVVLAWQRADDLISYMDAARLFIAAGLVPPLADQMDERRLFRSIEQRVRRAVASGQLGQRYRNPAPSGDARGDWLVSERAVVAYLQERRRDA